MENVVSKAKYEFGDRVRHLRRPEWGVGTVAKVEPTILDGRSTQSLSVRFPSVGIKMLNTAQAELELVSGEHTKALADAEAHPIVQWGKLNDTDWLAPMARRKIQEAMISLPPVVRDPFEHIRARAVRARIGDEVAAKAVGAFVFDVDRSAVEVGGQGS